MCVRACSTPYVCEHIYKSYRFNVYLSLASIYICICACVCACLTPYVCEYLRLAPLQKRQTPCPSRRPSTASATVPPPLRVWISISVSHYRSNVYFSPDSLHRLYIYIHIYTYAYMCVRVCACVTPYVCEYLYIYYIVSTQTFFLPRYTGWRLSKNGRRPVQADPPPPPLRLCLRHRLPRSTRQRRRREGWQRRRRQQWRRRGRRLCG